MQEGVCIGSEGQVLNGLLGSEGGKVVNETVQLSLSVIDGVSNSQEIV